MRRSSKFTYQTNHRPLPGYTLKRGLGQGGFGEVYLALSDSGKVVALKLIRGNADIELRGAEQCLNIKHPHLVQIFDLRTDERDQNWLIMEYVQGKSLDDVLDRHPDGLPNELIRQWFPALAQAVNHLHESGIVHRDLKPGNIFIENGHLKVGDYGLCKSLGEVTIGHTSNIGTGPYMAPELFGGVYHKQIDIYATGVVLFEMLTGRVPFDGEGNEVRIKHATERLNLSGVPEAYHRVLLKAMEKDSSRRYTSMLEMMRDFDQASQSMSPSSGSRAYVSTSSSSQRVTVDLYGPAPIAPTPSRPVMVYRNDPPKPPTSIPLNQREKISELVQSLALTPLLTLVPLVVWSIYQRSVDLAVLTRMMVLTFMVCAIILSFAKYWKPNGTGWWRRLIFAGCGALVGLFAFWMHGWTLEPTWPDPERPPSEWLGVASEGSILCRAFVLYFAIGLALQRWWAIPRRERVEQFTMYHGFVGLMIGGGLIWIFPSPRSALELLPIFPAAALIVQAVSPWQPIVVAPVRRRRKLHHPRTPSPGGDEVAGSTAMI